MCLDFQEFWVRDSPDPGNELKKIAKFVIAAAIIMLAIFCCTSCGTKKIITDERQSELRDSSRYDRIMDSVYHALVTKDYIYIHDSIIVQTEGDSTITTRWRDRAEWHILRDTVYRVRTDTLIVDKNSIKEKQVKESRQNVESWWRRLSSFAIMVLIGALLIQAKKWATDE